MTACLLLQKGDISGNAVAAGFPGEVISSNGTTTISSSQVYQQLRTITLTKGRWWVSAGANLFRNGASFSTGQNCEVSISPTTAVGSSIGGKDVIQYNDNVSTLSNVSFNFQGFEVTVASDTPYYLNGQCKFSSGNPQFSGYLQAIRL